METNSSSTNMLRPFQVNEGKFLDLDRDILPTAKVSELCAAIKVVSGEDSSSQVLLASDGRQMNPSETIGAYSITESQSVYVFYRSHLMSPNPPLVSTVLPQRGELQQHLELLKLKPAPSLFKRQVALAKRLSEYSVRLGVACVQLSEEYQLQASGWRTVLSNCTSITKMYEKHKELFAKSVEGFNQSKPQFLTLLKEFPSNVKLLQQLPVPSALSTELTPPSLYDWISTHDEKNSLQDLGSSCQRSLSRVDSDRIDSILESSKLILSDADSLLTEENQFNEKIAQLQALADEAGSKVDTQQRLAKNIQSTSEKALRSGDGGTIADLVFSHHRSLELMTNLCEELETLGQIMEKNKTNLTGHIHTKLKEVTQLQKKVADSNNQLVILHEHVKLAKKRFEILEQVCSAPDVLGTVLTEVERRRLYNSSLEKKTVEVSLLLKRAREEEKLLRRSFADQYSQHFMLTLFPELQDRVPNITVHLPESLTKPSLTAGRELERIKYLLESTRSLAVDLNCSSVQILSTPLALGDHGKLPTSEQHSSKMDSGVDSSLTNSKVTTTESYIQTSEKFDDDEKRKLYEKLDLITEELRLERTQFTIEKEQFETILNNERSENTALQSEIHRLNKERERVIDTEHTKSILLVQIEEISKEKQELQKQLNVGLLKITQLSNRVEQFDKEVECLKKENSMHKSRLAQQEIDYQSEQNRLQQHISELNTSKNVLLTRLTEVQGEQRTTVEEFELERTKSSKMIKTLNEQIAKLRAELEESQTEQKLLLVQASKAQDLENVSDKRELEIQQLKQELQNSNMKLQYSKEQFEDEVQKLCAKCDELKSKLLQVEQTSTEKQQHLENLHQMATKSLKSQLEKAQQLVKSAQQKENECKEKLILAENKLASTNSLIQKLEIGDQKAQEKLKNLSDKLLEYENERKELLKSAEDAKIKIQDCEKDLEEARKESDKLLHESEEKQAKLCLEIEDLKAKCVEISAQGDSYMKRAMEVERELKELQRNMGLSPPTSLELGEAREAPVKPLPLPVAASKVLMTVSIGMLQAGDTALFVSDSYGNYLALTVDDKTYYLNQTSVKQLDDITPKIPKLNLPRKMLCGKLTNKVLVEVRKENNRLRVPVGERLYKVDAEPCVF